MKGKPNIYSHLEWRCQNVLSFINHDKSEYEYEYDLMYIMSDNSLIITPKKKQQATKSTHGSFSSYITI